jgi:hypothetical protein
MPASSSKTCLPLTSPSATYQDGPGYFWEKIVLRPGPPPAPNPVPPPPDPLPLPVEKPAQADKFDESVVRCRDGTDPCQGRIAQHIMGRTMLTNMWPIRTISRFGLGFAKVRPSACLSGPPVV